jgi:hypothetical protein
MTILQCAEVGLKSCNAITTEEEDAHIYRDFAGSLRKEFPASAELFERVTPEEDGHRHRLIELYKAGAGLISNLLIDLINSGVGNFEPRPANYSAFTIASDFST